MVARNVQNTLNAESTNPSLADFQKLLGFANPTSPGHQTNEDLDWTKQTSIVWGGGLFFLKSTENNFCKLRDAKKASVENATTTAHIRHDVTKTALNK